MLKMTDEIVSPGLQGSAVVPSIIRLGQSPVHIPSEPKTYANANPDHTALKPAPDGRLKSWTKNSKSGGFEKNGQ
jgi:hypothetical protein